MKIILTGAAGFIGSCYLWKLNSLGLDDIWLVDSSSKAGDSPNLIGKKFKDYLGRDQLLRDLDTPRLKEADLIVHLGACADTTEKDRDYLARNNVQFSQTLGQWALAQGKRFHYASSASVYGDGKSGYSDADEALTSFRPLNPYAESKWAFDRWVIENKLTDRFVGFRYFNVFGPNEYHKGEMRSMVCKAFDQIEAMGRAKLFASTRPGHPDGSEERDFVYVKDVTEVMSYFLEHPARAGIFNLGTGKARPFRDLANAVFSALGRSPQIEYISMPESLRGQYQYFTQADTARLRKAGYSRSFQSLEESVADYVRNYLAPGKKCL